MQFPEALAEEIASQPYPLVFVTLSGAHLYGFPSPDSDFDLRGVHVLPARDVLGLSATRDTIEVSRMRGELEMDLVTHDVKKFFQLLLRKNGYVLEQLYSPLVLRTSAEHTELLSIARGCITRHHVHHYAGFARTQWQLFEKVRPLRVKPLLYVYRVLLSGLHLMRTGEVEANLLHLNETERLPYIPELVQRKLAGPEHSTLEETDLEPHRLELERLLQSMKDESERSALPDAPQAKPALEDLLVRLRLGRLQAAE